MLLLAGVVLVVGAGAFGLGVVAGREPVPSDPTAAPASPPPSPAAPSGPRILLDPASVVLLPDASLRLDLPAPPDAGATDPRPR